MKSNVKEYGVSKRVVGYWKNILVQKLASNSRFGKHVLSISLESSIRLCM